MMRLADSFPRVFLCKQAVDFRKSIDGLALLVEGLLGLDPFAEQVYVFTNRRRNQVKLLYWERNGFVLWYKRLERERFHWPVHLEGEVVTLSGRELNFLLDGLNLRYLRPHARLRYRTVA